VNRRDFQRMADIRATEAEVLLAAQRYSGAYYLAGYVVGCALKARIAKQVRRHEFPDRTRVNQSYTPGMDQLLRLAGLEPELDESREADPELGRHWATVKEWKEDSRYERVTRKRALELYSAITDPDHGVLTWLQLRW